MKFIDNLVARVLKVKEAGAVATRDLGIVLERERGKGKQNGGGRGVGRPM